MSAVLGYYVVTFMVQFLNQINSAQSQERMIRSSIRSMLENQLTPDFYPTRGRRARPNSEEETEPPFWAQRGRSYEPLSPTWTRALDLSSSNNLEDSPRFLSPSLHHSAEDKELPFWASRGRSPPPNCIDPNLSLAYAEEPRVVVIERRDASDDDRNNYSQFWASRGRRDQYGHGHRPSKRNTVKLRSTGEGRDKRSNYEDQMQLQKTLADH